MLKNIITTIIFIITTIVLFKIFDYINNRGTVEFMTKKEDVITIDVNSTTEEILNTIKKHKYTRFPVIENNEIIGVLNIKDLLIKQNKNFKLKDYIRKITTLKSNMIIDDAYLYLNSNYEVIAKVIKNDEYIGIITLEDIIEELIGNVFDEYDKTKEEVK